MPIFSGRKYYSTKNDFGRPFKSHLQPKFNSAALFHLVPHVVFHHKSSDYPPPIHPNTTRHNLTPERHRTRDKYPSFTPPLFECETGMLLPGRAPLTARRRTISPLSYGPPMIHAFPNPYFLSVIPLACPRKRIAHEPRTLPAHVQKKGHILPTKVLRAINSQQGVRDEARSETFG